MIKVAKINIHFSVKKHSICLTFLRTFSLPFKQVLPEVQVCYLLLLLYFHVQQMGEELQKVWVFVSIERCCGPIIKITFGLFVEL